MENKKKRPGRKKLKPDVNDKAKGYNVSIKPSIATAVINKYGSLSAAIRSIYATVPNPHAFTFKKD